LYRLYVLISYLALPLVALVLLWKGIGNPPYRERFPERFGFGRSRLDRPGIWVHAVSVGEVVAASPLVEALLRDYPDYPVVITTVTPTGAQQVRDLFGGRVLHSYAPYDTPGSVRRFFERMQPRLAIVMETELWPNLYAECSVRKVPLVLANARISPRSVGRYRRFGRLFRAVLAHGVVVAAQSREDAERFRLLGADPARTVVTGNLKADLRIPDGLVEAGRNWREGNAGTRPVWIAASTHEGEEQAAVAAHDEVRERLGDALLLLVPRHPDRFDGVAEMLARRGTSFVRRSSGHRPAAEDPVFLVDTLGELMQFYAAADVAFVGGSLVPVGGHNLLEPAALSLPVLAGPHNYNAADIAGLLREAGGLEIVADAAALGPAVTRLLQDQELRRDRGAAARHAAAASSGALEELLRLIAPLLDARR
jgi:3-deoxy-D-manno-octulosonic-acid transferase